MYHFLSLIHAVTGIKNKFIFLQYYFAYEYF